MNPTGLLHRRVSVRKKPHPGGMRLFSWRAVALDIWNYFSKFNPEALDDHLYMDKPHALPHREPQYDGQYH